MLNKTNKFQKKQIYSRQDQEKLTLVKCENHDGSLSYKLGYQDGYLISDKNQNRSLRNFEDLLDIQKGYKETFKELNKKEKRKSVLGENIDDELSEVQDSFYSYLEEIAIKI